MNRPDYDRKNSKLWADIPDTEKARHFGTTRQAITAARKVRGIPPSTKTGDGGARPGAGAKPRKHGIKAEINRAIDRAYYSIRKSTT